RVRPTRADRQELQLQVLDRLAHLGLGFLENPIDAHRAAPVCRTRVVVSKGSARACESVFPRGQVPTLGRGALRRRRLQHPRRRGGSGGGGLPPLAWVILLWPPACRSGPRTRRAPGCLP